MRDMRRALKRRARAARDVIKSGDSDVTRQRARCRDITSRYYYMFVDAATLMLFDDARYIVALSLRCR